MVDGGRDCATPGHTGLCHEKLNLMTKSLFAWSAAKIQIDSHHCVYMTYILCRSPQCLPHRMHPTCISGKSSKFNFCNRSCCFPFARFPTNTHPLLSCFILPNRYNHMDNPLYINTTSLPLIQRQSNRRIIKHENCTLSQNIDLQ